MTPAERYSHVAVTVSDLDTAARFFIVGLGFRPVPDEAGAPRRLAVGHDLGRQLAPLLEVAEYSAEVLMLARDSQVVELVGYRDPPPELRSRPPMNACGPTHFGFLVEHIDEVAASLAALGGEVLADTRVTVDLPDGSVRSYVMCLTPDRGLRIELTERSAQCPS